MEQSSNPHSFFFSIEQVNNFPFGSTMELPDENIFDMLLMLPVKTLVRFKAVSKEWCSLISDPEFIKAHFSRLDQMSSKILLSTQPHACILDYENRRNSMLNYPVPIQTTEMVTFVGSCNGLVCLLLHSFIFILWNPSTREFRRLPPLIPSSEIYKNDNLSEREEFVQFDGFGYDSSIDDYKIVIGFWPKPSFAETSPGYFVVQCFSLKTNKWKFIGFHKLDCHFEHHRGVLLNGYLHWISEDGKAPVVSSFNIKEERFMEVVRLPRDCHTQSYQMWLYAFENSLFLCNLCRDTNTKSYIEVWEKNADAAGDSWKKLYLVRIRLLGLPFSYRLQFTRNYRLVLGFHSTGLRTFDLQTKTSKNLRWYGSPLLDGIAYRETLISPN